MAVRGGEKYLARASLVVVATPRRGYPWKQIVELAHRQHGNVTIEQLLALGLSRSWAAHQIKSGILIPVHRGVYAVGRRPKTPVEKAAAAVLACGESAALSDVSALVLWGIWKRWTNPVHVAVATKHRIPGIRAHRLPTLSWRDIRRHYGIRITTPARTLLDVAQSLSDKQLARTVNQALHSPFMTPGQLADLVLRVPHHQQVRRLARFVPIGSSGPTRSEMEQEFLRFCIRFGFPLPLVNTIVCGWEADAFFPEHKLIVEIDSWRFHSTRIDFETDRLRDADHLVAGIATLRITYERLIEQPELEAERLWRILERRGPGRPVA